MQTVYDMCFCVHFGSPLMYKFVLLFKANQLFSSDFVIRLLVSTFLLKKTNMNSSHISFHHVLFSVVSYSASCVGDIKNVMFTSFIGYYIIFVGYFVLLKIKQTKHVQIFSVSS